MPSSVCDGCALRLYNTKSYNLHGVGNPFSGNCIVVPNVDYKAYKGKSMDFSTQVEVIRNILIPFTGGGESNFYIVPLINSITRVGTMEEKQLLFDSMLDWRAYNLVPSTKRGAAKGAKETVLA